MGREFQNVAVIKGYSADGSFVIEDVLPLTAFNANGSHLLISTQVRQENGIRFVSVRLFDESGVRIETKSLYYNLKGEPVEKLIRRPDGSIIEDADKYV
jgi:hypothetical protein